MIAIPAVELSATDPLYAAGSKGGVTRSAPRTNCAGLARELSDLGFSRLHVGASSVNASTFPALEHVLRETSARVQVGGVSTTNDIEQLLRVGAEFVATGDRGIEEPDWLADVADLYPDAIAVTTDVRDRRVVRRGWVRTLPVDILDLVDELNVLPLSELLISIRPLDGAMRIGELALLEDVAERSRCPVLVAGGVGSIQDLRALEHRGIAGAVIDADRLLRGSIDGSEVAREFGGA